MTILEHLNEEIDPYLTIKMGSKLLFYGNYGGHFNIKIPSIQSVQIFFPAMKVKKHSLVIYVCITD